MDTSEKNQIRDEWTKIAHGYDRFVTPTHLDLGADALQRAGLAADMMFLDVACGTGALSLPAARLGARVTAVDLSPGMVEQLNERARNEGYSNVEAHVMDGCALALENNSFDVVGSQFGVMLFPDLPGGLREMVRVTRAGGKVVVVAFGPPQEVEFIAFMMKAMRSVVPGFTGLPLDPPPLPFQMADPNRLHQEFINAGLTEVGVERTSEKMAFESGQQLWDWLMNSNPIPGQLVADLSEEQKAQIRGVLEVMIRERSRGREPAILTSPINIAIGTRS